MNGIGMAFTSSTTTYLGVIGSTLKSLKRASSSYGNRGAGFYTDGIGETECRFTCFSKNEVYEGQSFFIKSSTDKSLSTDLTISQCPEEYSSYSTRGALDYEWRTFETEVTNTNISSCKLTGYGVFRWYYGGNGKASYSTAVGNFGDGVLRGTRESGSPTYSFTKMNIVGNERKDTSDYLIYLDTSSTFSLSDSIFIDNVYGSLSNSQLTITNSIFFDCTFDTTTSVTTATTRPFTWVPNYLRDPKWFPTPIPSNTFTLQSNLNAVLVQSAFLVIPG